MKNKPESTAMIRALQNDSVYQTAKTSLSSTFLKIEKEKPTEKVDGIVSLVMVLDRAMKNQDGESVYDTRGLLII